MKHLLLFAALILFHCAAFANIVYVKANATGLNNGTSWANAYTDLNSVAGFTNDSVWVANGVYATTSIEGFRIWDNLKLFGGFAGTETQLSQRNWSTYQTILDGQSFAHQVVSVKCQVINSTPVPNLSPLDLRLDGFKVMNGVDTGNANVFHNAGGVTCYNSRFAADRIVIANCFFTQNHGGNGGAILLTSYGDVSVTNCRFEKNTAIFGGAVSQYPFVFLSASSIDSASHVISDCVFSNNSALYGGAIHSSYGLYSNGVTRAFRQTDSAPTAIIRCIFRGNTATVAGGAIADSIHSRLRVYNSLMIGNIAPRASVYYRAAVPSGATAFPTTLVHCTVAGNKSTAADSLDYPVYLSGGDTVRNCIFWDNVSGSGKQLRVVLSGPAFISNNIMQGVMSLPLAVNTYTFDPQFAAPGSSASAPFALSGSYDYHLKLASAAIDTGLAGIPVQGNVNTSDLDGNARVQGSRPDLGAYEKTFCLLAPASVLPNPVVICQPDSVLLTGSGSGKLYWNAATTPSATLWARSGGTYHIITTSDSTGCRSKATFIVMAYAKPSPAIIRTGNTLSVAPVYSTYQWYKGGIAVTGANAASYNPSANGLYKIVVTNGGGCKDSTTYNLTNLAVNNVAATGRLSIYPNPAAEGRFSISFEAKHPVTELMILVSDVTGRQTLRRQYYNTGSSFSEEVDIGAAPKGIYCVRVTADGAVIVGIVVIK